MPRRPYPENLKSQARLRSPVPRYAPLELCRNKAGYETEPLEPVALDLADVEKRAPAAGLEPLVNAGVILVLKAGRVELSLFEKGKMLFKTRDRAEAEEARRAVFELLGWA